MIQKNEPPQFNINHGPNPIHNMFRDANEMPKRGDSPKFNKEED